MVQETPVRAPVLGFCAPGPGPDGAGRTPSYGPRRRALLPLCALLACLSGCGDSGDAEDVARRFIAALEVMDFEAAFLELSPATKARLATLEEKGGVQAGEVPNGLSVFRDRATFGGRVSGPPVGRGAARRIVIERIDDRSVRARDPSLAASRGFLLVFEDGRYWVELEIEAAAVEDPPR